MKTIGRVEASVSTDHLAAELTASRLQYLETIQSFQSKQSKFCEKFGWLRFGASSFLFPEGTLTFLTKSLWKVQPTASTVFFLAWSSRKYLQQQNRSGHMTPSGMKQNEPDIKPWHPACIRKCCQQEQGSYHPSVLGSGQAAP